MDDSGTVPLGVESLARTLSAGFEALLEEVKIMARRENFLRQKLDHAAEVCSVSVIPFLHLSLHEEKISN